MQTHKLRTKVKDDLFNMDTLAHYFLCIKFSQTYIEIAVFDTKIDRCVAYEYHDIYSEDESTMAVGLSNFVKSHAFLGVANWKAIYFMDCGLHYGFVPDEFHHNNYTAAFLKLTSNIDKQAYAMKNTQHLSQSCYCHFATPKSIADWSKVVYRDREVIWIHQSSAFIEGLSKYPDKLDSGHLHILYDKNSICVAHFKNGKLNFTNSFSVKDDKDSIYYIMLVVQELGLDQKETKVWVYGNIEEDKGLMGALPNYLANVKISPRPKNQNFGYHFDDMKPCHGFDVFSAYYFTK